jgi:hypothetical protein
MKKRYVYALLFGLPGLFAAGILSIGLFGGLTGGLLIYVFGDNPWPTFTETVVSILFVLTVSALWIGSIVTGFLVGTTLESNSVLNRNHVLISAGLTLVFILFMVFYQWRIGTSGPAPDSMLCSEFCTQHGYPGSSMPPITSGSRLCSCHDDAGNEALRIPLDHIAPQERP